MEKNNKFAWLFIDDYPLKEIADFRSNSYIFKYVCILIIDSKDV